LTDIDAIEDWVQHADNFYVNQECDREGLLVPMDKRFLKRCTACSDKRIKKLRHVQMLKDNNEPLRGLELFSGEFFASYIMMLHVQSVVPGAGGLGTGMNMSGFVETRYAVEFSPSAALTYQ
jgi:DNA (cytosine-5)-methyltransferase 1